MERGVILSSGDYFRMPELDPHQSDRPPDLAVMTYAETERALIRKALKVTGGKISGKDGAAELLQINRTTLSFRMKKLGINKKEL